MARRKRKPPKPKKEKRRANIFVYLFFFILFAIVFVYILSLPIWQIKDVVVNGAVMLSDNEIKALAAIPLSENLFFTSFARAKTNLGKITAIKKCRFYRIPPATVLINVTEREPIATIIFPQKSAIIDREGYIINRNPNIYLNIPSLADLPVVSGISESKVLGSEKVEAKISQTVYDIISKLSPYLESKRMQIELGELEDINLLLDDLLRVKVGRAENIKRKMEVFEGLLTVIAGKWGKVDYVDVRFPDNPVIRYR
jgi:cell division protein FtsQ